MWQSERARRLACQPEYWQFLNSCIVARGLWLETTLWLERHRFEPHYGWCFHLCLSVFLHFHHWPLWWIACLYLHLGGDQHGDWRTHSETLRNHVKHRGHPERSGMKPQKEKVWEPESLIKPQSLTLLIAPSPLKTDTPPLHNPLNMCHVVLLENGLYL